MTLVDDGANSSYNGLIAAVQHRMSNNFSFLANYTWSHCISPGDAPGDVAAPHLENPTTRVLDRGHCGFDVRHIFNTTLIASSHFSSLHGYAQRDGQQLADRSARPHPQRLPSTSPPASDNSLTGQGLDRPNLVNAAAVYTGNKITRGHRAIATSSATAAFTQNAPEPSATSAATPSASPTTTMWTPPSAASSPLHERLALNVRLEAFNVLNHPNFNGFTTALNSSTFGYAATTAQDPRIFQAAAKFTF